MYDVVLSRAGVLEYRNDDGSPRFELRPESEVFSRDSMASFDGMAVTDYHPNGVPVDVKNRSTLGRGYIVPGSLRRDGMKLIGTIHVTDAKLIADVKAGRTAVSLGYFQDRVRESGVSTEDGRSYTHKQTNIRGNHVAIVDIARAGDEARLITDSITNDPNHGDTNMDELKKALNTIMTLEIEANKSKLRLDSLDADIATTKKTLATVEAERDALKDKLEKSDKLRMDGEKNALISARARVDLETAAVKVLTVDSIAPKFDGKTDRQIREDVIVKLTGKPVPAGKSDDYIQARYDGLVEDAASRDGNDNKNASAIVNALVTKPDSAGAAPVTLASVLNEDGSYNDEKTSKLTAAQMQKLNADRDANAWRSKK